MWITPQFALVCNRLHPLVFAARVRQNIGMDAEEHKKHIQKMKELLEKREGKEVTWEEAEEASRNLAGLAEILYELWVKEQGWKKRLQESPEGFVLEGRGRTCAICHESSREEGSWYDKWGVTCLTCHGAVDRKEIPGSLAKRERSYYREHELQRAFNLKHSDITRWIKEGVLKARTVTDGAGRVHARLFLIKDNEGTLPPKKLVESQLVKEDRDGQTWYRSYEWYCFGDPRETLKGYKIMDHLRIIPPEEMKAREEQEKRQWEERRAKREARKKLRKKL